MRATQLPAFETISIAHTQEQIVRGYLCGSNSKRWHNHIFNYNNLATSTNLKSYFYCFEFQKRGTLHLHMLVWLKDIRKIQHQHIRADIPFENPDLAYYVHKLQPSDKKSNCLNLQAQNTYFSFESGKHVHHIKHPADAFALNLRAYIDTLLPSLKCRVDYQTTDGVAMLLKYVTPYVTKCHDANTVDALYSYHINGRQVAVRYLMSDMPAEPEMYFYLYSKKTAWTNNRTKRFYLPNTSTVYENKVVLKYWKRPQELNAMSLIDWLRNFNTNCNTPKWYKDGATLVGLNMLSVFNKEFFFQYILLHLPHRNVLQLVGPDNDNLPEHLKWFHAACFHFPLLWKSKDNISSFFSVRGHRESFVTTIISYIESLQNSYCLWKIDMLKTAQLTTNFQQERLISLDAYQTAVFWHVKKAMTLREQYYSYQHGPNCTSASDLENTSEMILDNYPWKQTV